MSLLVSIVVGSNPIYRTRMSNLTASTDIWTPPQLWLSSVLGSNRLKFDFYFEHNLQETFIARDTSFIIIVL